MRCGAVLCMLGLALAGFAGIARADECPGNPNALGTSRTLVVDPTEHPRVGTMQYPQTLPLADKEVVLTFDDGPLPRYSKEVLEILASQCVKATYFLVGRMAHDFPETVREIRAAGHTIGTHSQNHPFSFQRMDEAHVEQEVQGGIDSVKAALGGDEGLSPFFRIPGLLRADTVETYLEQHHLMTWSADFPADDWRHISAAEITKRALRRLEAHGKGILLLHDIHAATVKALPNILRELKARGYHVVHVVAATPTLPKTPTEPEQWYMHPHPNDLWAHVAMMSSPAATELAAPSPASFGLPHRFNPLPVPMRAHGRLARRAAAAHWPTVWPRLAVLQTRASSIALPVPAWQRLDFYDVLGERPAAVPLQVGSEPIPSVKAMEPPPGRRADAAPAAHISDRAPLPAVGIP